MTAYGTGKPQDGGWSITGDGGASTKATYNLLGGFVEFDLDLSKADVGVNANIYTISPSVGSSGFNNDANYCDAAGKKPWCVEVDWIESNGNCGGVTTLHTKNGTGVDGCNSWGCKASYRYNGKSSFHMRIEHGIDGSWTTIRDGQKIDAGTLQPSPGADAWAAIKSAYESKGALIYSSQWGGWVPLDAECGAAKPDAGNSQFSVKNLKIKGSVVQGPKPTACSSSPTSSPSPAPSGGNMTAIIV